MQFNPITPDLIAELRGLVDARAGAGAGNSGALAVGLISGRFAPPQAGTSS